MEEYKIPTLFIESNGENEGQQEKVTSEASSQYKPDFIISENNSGIPHQGCGRLPISVGFPDAIGQGGR